MPTVETQHGPIEYEDGQVFHMLGGLIGFADATKFVLLESPEVDPFRWLVSVDKPELSFAVIDPRLLVPDFHIGLAEPDRARLEITEESDVLPLAISVLSTPPEGSTANLKAPIVVNSTRMLAQQVVLTTSDYSVKHPLLPSGNGSES